MKRHTMRKCLRAIYGTILCIGNIYAQQPDVTSSAAIFIGSRLELLIDTMLIDQMEGASLRMHQPVRKGIVMEYDKPWEGNGCSFRTIFRDGDSYRMYYTAWKALSTGEQRRQNTIAYAESHDGIHWERPTLHLKEFNGSTANNIVMDNILGEPMHDFSVFKDDRAGVPADELYKAVGIGRKPRGLYAFKSADGFRWELMQDTPVITGPRLDSQNLAFWDESINKYRVYVRGMRDTIRDIMTAVSDDFVHWSTPKFLNYPGAPDEQLYTAGIKPYYRAPHIYIGFPARYVDRGWTASTEQLPEPTLRHQRSALTPRFGTVVTDALLMNSRDGLVFHRWPEAFIKPGLRTRDNWSYGDNFVAWGLVETDSDIPDAPRELSLYATESYFTGESSLLCRYTLRIDGFASAYATINGGELVSKPVIFSGSRLVLNYATAAAGSLFVELQDEYGNPLPGYTVDDCDIIYGDQLERMVTWRGDANVSALEGKPIRLRFLLADADLYSFRFQKAPQITNAIP